MAINKIDLKSHLEKAIPYSEGAKVLMAFLEKHKQKGKRKHYRPLGQNVAFDLGFYKAQLTKNTEWDKIVDYRVLDTSSVCVFMQDIGLLPTDIGNLGSLVAYFGVKQEEAHEAKADVTMTIGVYKKMKETFRKNSLSGGISSDMLSVIEE